MVVFWSVELGLVDEGVCFCANSEDVEVGDGEDSEVIWGLVCARGGRFLMSLMIFF